MDQTLDARQQKSEAPKKEEFAPDRARQEGRRISLTPVLQAIRAGLPVRELPPATLMELAGYLGNSAMEALLGREDPGSALAWPQLGPPGEGAAYDIAPEAPALCAPPALSQLTPLAGSGSGPAALRGAAGGLVWPAAEGGGAS